jgi:2-dehydropantoate 2-reductase
VSEKVAVLGIGAVGTAIAARVAAIGTRVLCVGRPETVAALRADGLEVETPDGPIRARPEAVESLTEPVSLLVVAVKATALAEALERVEVFAVADGVVLSLENGLEHPTTIRRRLGPRVAPGTISRFSGERLAPGHTREHTRIPLVTAATGDHTRHAVERALRPVAAAGIDVAIADDEASVLWEKTARLGPLAAATSASGLAVGELRGDTSWRRRLDAALTEAIAVAAADGVELDPAAQWAVIEGMPAEATTSTALDVVHGRPSELDAIAGSVLRAARRHGLACPTLEALVAEVEA